jgi:CRISPR-associated protein (TIGR02710 family)
MKILLVTVGGSHQPILKAIRTLNPDRVVFLCSGGDRTSRPQVDGGGKPCEVRRNLKVTEAVEAVSNKLQATFSKTLEKYQIDNAELLDLLETDVKSALRPFNDHIVHIEPVANIVQLANLQERFDPERDIYIIDDLDDFSACYLKAVEAIGACSQEGNELWADYTGATKTMSVGLAMAALDYQVQLFLTTGSRRDLLKVQHGEATERVAVVPVIVRRTLDQVLPPLFNQYHYSAAIASIEELLTSAQIPRPISQQVREQLELSRGLDAWDRFDHRVAIDYLEPFDDLPAFKQLFLQLKRTAYSRSLIDSSFDNSSTMKGHCYEIVEDLLLNAERRAAQSRYDDAVGRLYRAIELLVQLRLKLAYSLLTGDLDVALLPESVQPKYEALRISQGKIKIALDRSYELLVDIGSDPLGALYSERRSRILNALQVRNHSLFAHGFQPITQSDYKVFCDVIVTFIREGIATVVPAKHKVAIQFPGVISL